MKQYSKILFAAAAAIVIAASSTFAQEAETTQQIIARTSRQEFVPNSKTNEPVKKTTKPEPQAASDSNKWRFESAPYVWFAGLDGELKLGTNTVTVDQSPTDLLKQLDFAFATHAEIWKGKFGILIDENYVNLGTTGEGPLGAPTDVQPTTNFFEIGPSFELYSKPNKESTAAKPLPPVFSAEILGGVRAMHNGLGLTRPNLNAEGSTNIVDAFVGNRIKVRPAPPLTLIGKWTVGGGGSKHVWTLTGLVDFRFNKSISIWGGYQLYDINTDKLGRNVSFNGQMRGFLIGATIYK
mgnify:FL=1